jgi:DNA repair photolyase
MAALPLLPENDRPRLIGIARLAAEGDSLREGHNVEYFTLPSRSLLNRCVSKRNLPFEWAINPYRGCEFACKYCYARYTHEFMELRDGADFERKIFVKQHAADLLRQELRRVKTSESIAIGTATDPYQPAERRYEVTRGILEELARHRGLSIGIVTKSNLILRDVELLRELGRANRVFVSLTITTLDVELARILEPRAPRPDLRMDAVRQLNLAGVAAGVNCAPVLPGITDSVANLEAVVSAAASAQAKNFFANTLFLKPCSAAVFMPFLKEKFPHLAESYRKRYEGRAFLPPAYTKRVSEMMKRLRAKYGFRKEARRNNYEEYAMQEQEASGEQMKLF